MKKKYLRLSAMLLCLALLAPLAVVPVWAESEAPYETYTFDKWGNAVSSPDAYLPTEGIGGAQLGCGNFSGALDLFYCGERGEMYVVDTGNNRIVVLSDDMKLIREIPALTGEDGSEYTFSAPQGIFVQPDGTMYVADTGNKTVVVGTVDGRLRSKLSEPRSNLLPDNFNYQPSKVVVDSNGRIYILSQGIYQGLIYLEPDGTFIKFFGPNEVEMTFKRQIQKIWKTILTDKAASTMQSFNPIEYGNIYLSEDGYIYATAAGSENGSKLITKLNPLGIDSLPFKMRVTDALFSDVTADANGIITILNTNNGKLTQLNKNGNTLFQFGGTGDQLGLFQRAVSIVEVGDDLYVLDADKDTITKFELTEFGSLVRRAINLYDTGLYRESIEPWQEVIRRNANYLVAYTGLGKAYYQLKDYDTAMYYYKLANDRVNYSEAYREASLNHMRDSFGYIVLSVAAVILLIVVGKNVYDRVDPDKLWKPWRRKEKGSE